MQLTTQTKFSNNKYGSSCEILEILPSSLFLLKMIDVGTPLMEKTLTMK